MKNKIFNIGVIILSTVMLLYFAVFSKGVNNLKYQLKNLNHFWILLSILAMITYWIIESFVLNTFTKFLGFNQKMKDSFKISMVGQFFNSVTPFASGGQPAQLYFMTKKDINGGSATSILMMKLIVYQSVLTIYSLISIILKYRFFKKNLSNFFSISIIGFLINTLIILFLLLASTKRELAEKILKGILKFLHKIHLVKNVDKTLKKLDEEIYSFHNNAVEMSKNISLLIKCTVLTFVQLTVYFIIPYFIYRGFNFNSASLWNMVSAETFLNMIVSVIPLPGAAGGSEGGFYLLFSLFFTKETIMAALLLWRIITYYSCIAVGSLFTVTRSRKLVTNQ
ncbi:lysylphosphatidylglycerol synthase transmembrane domain-containing protein [Clostridium brassicae]|uniref:Phosphatidylglycerol lysyltransferase n=1 Tax=Clostridium brassicae TaxID=2999072 RepID=A0ABT4DAQ7_9CLOT|nr:lysylphosphatidylglycerol synthase transmembrane domain-containing protein [Clostridium brassicae]MCY6959394.1 lysylphosphatidylglycerol synthase transmembrane domain-containing protein [Clostridium brassicae]